MPSHQKNIHVITARGLVDHFSTTFDVISDMIQNSVFRQSEIKKEAGVIVDELKDVEDNPEELIFDKFEEILFSGNSLSYPIFRQRKKISENLITMILLTILIRNMRMIECLSLLQVELSMMQ